jgi:hypothetical protein
MVLILNFSVCLPLSGGTVSSEPADPSPFMRTWSGKKFYFNNLDETAIVIEDIAHALSLQCRFNGHCNEHYSVAEHSIRVAGKLLVATGDAHIALTGLLHDAAETYTGDVISPLKKLLPGFKEIEKRIETCVSTVFGITYPFPPEVHAADKDVLDEEFSSIGPFCGARSAVKTLAPKQAEVAFLEMYERLRGAISK